LKELIKNIYRFIKHKEHRQKLFREFAIKKKQKTNFKAELNSNIKKLIVFTLPGADRVTGKETMSGGVISILSIAQETKNLFKNSTEIAVIVCTLPKDNLLLKFNNIENDFNIYDYRVISKKFNKVSEIILHIPDCYFNWFFKCLSKKEHQFLLSKTTHINLLNQNIKLMPDVMDIQKVKIKYSLITITTAHQQYSTQYYRDYFGVPLHKLSVWISPEQYHFKSFQEKENLLIYSPDERPEKNKIIEKLSQIEGLKLQMIKGITYAEFKNVISRSKWALTFGEGLDGYILEPIFSGAIGFAVYNKDFFTEDFKELKTIYKSYDDLYDKIQSDIVSLDNNDSYKNYQQIQYKICENQYSSKVYKENIRRFYNAEFNYK
jgi:hypothetical protein